MKRGHYKAYEQDPKKAFMKNVSPEPNSGCWLWQGNMFKCRGGYGSFTHRASDTIQQRAHRVAWKLFVDNTITKEDHVLHRCDNPLCVNPDHLFLGDQALNMEDKSYKGRQRRGEDHPMYIHGRYVGDKENPKYARLS